MIADYPAPGTEPVGGPRVAVARLVRRLVERGLDVIVVCPDPFGSSTTETPLEDGARLVTVPAGHRLTLARGTHPWRRRAAEVVDRLGADVVHGQGLIVGGVAAVGVKTDVPVVVTARGNARRDIEAEYNGVGGITRAYLRDRLAALAVKEADVVIGVNPEWSVNMPRRPKRFVYLPNMIDEYFFTRTHEADTRRVLFAGGTRAIKGWALLADAWPLVLEAVPEARLEVVNWPSKTLPPGIPSHIEPSIVVREPLSSVELADVMARSAALVIPSEFEVSPIVLAEAWAVGLPVVAAPVGGIPALATGAAILAEREPAALADALVSALGGGADVDDLVAEGRRRAEAHRPDAVTAGHVALYEELAARERG